MHILQLRNLRHDQRRKKCTEKKRAVKSESPLEDCSHRKCYSESDDGVTIEDPLTIFPLPSVRVPIVKSPPKK